MKTFRLSPAGYLLSAMAITLVFATVESGVASIPKLDRVRVLETPKAITDVELVDQHDESFSLEDLQGKAVLVFFGFTNCPDVCPLAMSKFKQLQDSGNVDNERVAYVLVSVDGERDSPAAMKEYLENFSPDFVGLTADPDVVRPMVKSFSASFYKGHVVDGHYDMSHSPQTFVLDPDGMLRAEMYSAPLETMTTVVNSILSEFE